MGEKIANIKMSRFYLRLLWERMRTWRLRRFEKLPTLKIQMIGETVVNHH